MATQPVLVGGRWQASRAVDSFRAFDPATGETWPVDFPVSPWEEIETALDSAAEAAKDMRRCEPALIAAFLEKYAARLDVDADAVCATAHEETRLPIEPRLRNVELPRTTSQLRQAADAAREGSWKNATIDAAANLRSCFGPIGPVAVLGPNNFPLAFNAISGGDFAAAVACGNPVIAKAHPAHPRTSQMLAEHAHEACRQAGLPLEAVQLVYHVEPASGERLVADPRLGAVAFTGSRAVGLRLKACADAVGKPIYLEMSSVNPVFFLPGALRERAAELVAEVVGSCLLASGQFCTSPNIFVLCGADAANSFLAEMEGQFRSRAPQPLLAASVRHGLERGVAALQQAGATLVAGGRGIDSPGYYFENTLLKVSAQQFLQSAEALQTEAFGNATLAVVAADTAEAIAVAGRLEGSLTASIYSAKDGSDDDAYGPLAEALRPRVGRLLNDKMPTGVAVSPAMNHGGPYPATGHPGFTAVGFPAAMRRFARLECYDAVREHRLPECLRDAPPHDAMWRFIDGQWRQGGASSRP